MVVIKTISNTELWIMDMALASGESFLSKVKMRAKATDPRIIPATVIISSS